jgi:hypothetical protein
MIKVQKKLSGEVATEGFIQQLVEGSKLEDEFAKT